MMTIRLNGIHMSIMQTDICTYGRTLTRCHSTLSNIDYHVTVNLLLIAAHHKLNSLISLSNKCSSGGTN